MGINCNPALLERISDAVKDTKKVIPKKRNCPECIFINLREP